MEKAEQEMIDLAATRVHCWLEDAVGDMAASYEHMLDHEKIKKVEKAKESGVIDIKGWLADEYYSDEETLQDLCGDKIFDEAQEICRKTKASRNEVYVAICDKIWEVAHPALQRALDKLIEDKK